MNRFKRGEKLHSDMNLALRNAHFMGLEKSKHTKYARESPRDEEYYLTELIQKAQSRLKQIREDKNGVTCIKCKKLISEKDIPKEAKQKIGLQLFFHVTCPGEKKNAS